MNLQEILIIIFLLICGCSLCSIQLRRIIKGEMRVFGLGGFYDAAKIQLDTFDKRMLLISGISFIIFIILVVTSFI